MTVELPPELWEEVRRRLNSWPDDQLVKAIAADKFTSVYAKVFAHANAAFEAEQQRLLKLSHVELVAQAFQLIEQNQKVAFYVDQGGYNAVYLDDE